MQSYDWEKNRAIVDRLYYSERILEGTTFAAVFATGTHALFLQRNYFAASSRRRIPKIWTYWAVANAVTLFVLLRPLQKEEIQVQWRKRKIMGKWLYSMFHLEPIEHNTSDSHEPKAAAGHH